MRRLGRRLRYPIAANEKLNIVRRRVFAPEYTRRLYGQPHNSG